MYTEYYGLSTQPFRLTPDPSFFFDSTPHKSALAYLRYGMQLGEGFIVVTGAVGTGKTTLSLTLLQSLSRSNLVIGELVTTQLQDEDLLRAIASTFRLDTRGTKSDLILRLQGFLASRAQAGKKVLLLVDEAHNLPQSSFEELRMLSNFHRGPQALLQCILLGQPPLRDILAQANMEQLQQRVIATHHLQPLSPTETRGYILHRLQQVGWKGDPSFSAEAVQHVYQYTRGIPRLINSLCNRILLFGYIEEKHQFEAGDIIQVYNEQEQELGHIRSTESIQKPQLNEVNTVGIAQEHVALKRAVGADNAFVNDKTVVHDNVTVMASPKVAEFASVSNPLPTGGRYVPGLVLPAGESRPLSTNIKDATPPLPSLQERFVEGLFQFVSGHKNSSTPFPPAVSEKSSLLLPLISLAVVLVIVSMVFSHYYPGSTIAPKLELPSSLKQFVAAPVKQKTVSAQESSIQAASQSTFSSVDKIAPERTVQERAVVPMTIGKKPSPEIPVTSENTSEPSQSEPAKGTSQFASSKSEFAALETQSKADNSPEAAKSVGQLDNPDTSSHLGHIGASQIASVTTQAKIKRPPDPKGLEQNIAQGSKINNRKSQPAAPVARSNKAKLSAGTLALHNRTQHQPQTNLPKNHIAAHASPTANKLAPEPLPGKNPIAQNLPLDAKEPEVSKAVSIVKPKEPPDPKPNLTSAKVQIPVKKSPVQIPVISQANQKTPASNNPAHVSQQSTMSSNSDSPVATKVAGEPRTLPIPTDKLNALLNLFRWAYDSGDMDTLEQLFASDARSDEYDSREAITQSYRKLFDITKERRLVVSDLRWSRVGDAVQGDGNFVVSVKEKGRNWTSSYNGKISLRVEKRDGQAVITTLSHSYSQ